MNRISIRVLLVSGLLIWAGCSVEKFIPEDELLYTGATIDVVTDTLVEKPNGLQAEMEAILRPTPNKKILGSRLGLYYHYKAQQEKPGFINRFLNKKLGEEPVYLSDVETEEMEKIFINRLENNGYFYSGVSSSIVEDTLDKSASAIYRLKLLEPYTMKGYQLDNDSLMVYQEIKQSIDKSVFKPGMRFSLNAMKAERLRIDNMLKAKGYYNFNPGFLIFEADTNQYKNRKFDLFVRLKNDVPTKSIVPYKIKTINIYPNYSLDQDSVLLESTRYAEKNFWSKELFFKPKRLDPFILLEEGQFFSPEISKNTSRRLSTIGAYKFINIEYKELDMGVDDSLGLLEANIFLSPLSKRSLRAELQAVTKSNSFAGPTLALTYSNRNIFNGGETFNLSAKVGYEVQTGGGVGQTGQSSLTLGLDGELIFPRLLFPISINKNLFRYNIPQTRVKMGVEYLNRSGLYSLASASATFGYVWQANKYVTHELSPLSLNYVRLGKTTPEFEKILDDNEFLRASFDQEFISGLTYSFTYNGMVDAGKTHQLFFNANFDTAGNSLGFVTGENGGGPKEFLGLQFAQYAKLDADIRYHFNFGKEQVVAARLFAGLGLPYGNSDVLPYTKQYFAGGPYSVRAFQIRSLGPGTYTGSDDGSSFFDQTGNLRLEANLEYRFPLISVLKGAIFADAGNIWNTDNDDATLPGGQFGSDWFNQLGVGTGAGMRVDIQSFVIRLDLAFPLRDPSTLGGPKWEFDTANPVLNFAIGYPF